jgi:hypothetical protein
MNGYPYQLKFGNIKDGDSKPIIVLIDECIAQSNKKGPL